MKPFKTALKSTAKKLCAKWPWFGIFVLMNVLLVSILFFSLGFATAFIENLLMSVQENLVKLQQAGTDITSNIDVYNLFPEFSKILMIIALFLVWAFLIYSFFQGSNWFFAYRISGKKVGYFRLLLRFFSVSILYFAVLYATLGGSVYAQISSSITDSLSFTLFYFVFGAFIYFSFINYSLISRNNIFISIIKTFKLGVMKIHYYLLYFLFLAISTYLFYSLTDAIITTSMISVVIGLIFMVLYFVFLGIMQLYLVELSDILDRD